MEKPCHAYSFSDCVLPMMLFPTFERLGMELDRPVTVLVVVSCRRVAVFDSLVGLSSLVTRVLAGFWSRLLPSYLGTALLRCPTILVLPGCRRNVPE